MLFDIYLPPLGTKNVFFCVERRRKLCFIVTSLNWKFVMLIFMGKNHSAFPLSPKQLVIKTQCYFSRTFYDIYITHSFLGMLLSRAAYHNLNKKLIPAKMRKKKKINAVQLQVAFYNRQIKFLIEVESVL